MFTTAEHNHSQKQIENYLNISMADTRPRRENSDDSVIK